ncbi:hypothetical protein [Pantoea ananatis]|uniref:hypothetical protein n=1 Tax=Pantoea ananas TaxID=553 RepID=UPI001B314CD0|nr:hypothetical protein [Pantoea ananatis]
MVQQAIDALLTHGIFWFDGNTSYGDWLCKQVQMQDVDCHFEPVGYEFENVLYLHEKFDHDQVVSIAERRLIAREKGVKEPIY